MGLGHAGLVPGSMLFTINKSINNALGHLGALGYNVFSHAVQTCTDHASTMYVVSFCLLVNVCAHQVNEAGGIKKLLLNHAVGHFHCCVSVRRSSLTLLCMFVP